MRSERVRDFFRSLRFRLTLWNTAVVFVLLLVNVLAVRGGLRMTVAQMADEFLTEELFSAVRDYDRLAHDPDQLRARLDRQATGHPRRRLFVQLVGAGGELVWSSEQAPPPEALPPDRVAPGRAATEGEYRYVCRPIRAPDGRPLTVRVGCSLRRAEQDVARFTATLLVVGAALLLAAPLGGYLLACRATRPVADIIRTTERLHPARLDERLPVRGTHDELDRLSQTINHFLDRIASYLRQSRDFTANAAHELRSPLTAMQSSLEVALTSERTVEQYNEVLAVLLEECGQLRVLVNQLLLLAEGDAGRLQLHSEPVRLDQVVARSLEMFQAVAEAAGVELTADRVEPVTVRGDGNRLWQVVNNLIDNALKFTPAPGRVSVALRLDEATGRGVLEVADTGPGIAPRDLPHVFERFYQGDEARERASPSRGLGLGLSICQAVVEAHGGAIGADSAPGRGTTFRVSLPGCARPPPPCPTH